MLSVHQTPLKTQLESESTTRVTRSRLVGNLGVLVYFVVLVCLSQVEVIFGGHSASASVYFGHFTYHSTPRWSPLIDDAEGFVRQSLDYLGVGLIAARAFTLVEPVFRPWLTSCTELVVGRLLPGQLCR